MLVGAVGAAVHHNDHAWTAPVEVADLVDLDLGLIEAWGDFLPRFRFLLDDLVRVDAQALRDRPLTSSVRLTLLLLKIAPGNLSLAKDLAPWVDELRAVLDGPDGREEFAALLRYIELVGEVETRDQLRDLIIALGPDAEEAYMTIAELHRAEGRDEGRLEGRVEGRLEGRVETLVQQLTLKFGPLPDAALTTVRNASADQLQAWTARVLTADSLDQLLR